MDLSISSARRFIWVKHSNLLPSRSGDGLGGELKEAIPNLDRSGLPYLPLLSFSFNTGKQRMLCEVNSPKYQIYDMHDSTIVLIHAADAKARCHSASYSNKSPPHVGDSGPRMSTGNLHDFLRLLSIRPSNFTGCAESACRGASLGSRVPLRRNLA
ncbi:hypothetical protein PsYK624_015090 [Phanerochaete sordida]|uniref:Uncharacterized protein n=1 Tax=Phanerochaete sordida TaxID=48140 RepID=A0A9P3FZZ2_9APHY|nr:hypothetical protein PsYK624_015090 [Phanerochaete sordida]